GGDVGGDRKARRLPTQAHVVAFGAFGLQGHGRREAEVADRFADGRDLEALARRERQLEPGRQPRRARYAPRRAALVLVRVVVAQRAGQRQRVGQAVPHHAEHRGGREVQGRTPGKVGGGLLPLGADDEGGGVPA